MLLVDLPSVAKEAKEVTELLYRDVICRYGTPLQLHSDNGTEFKNKTWKGLMQKLRIQVTNTPIYNPSSNAVEQFHQVLKPETVLMVRPLKIYTFYMCPPLNWLCKNR